MNNIIYKKYVNESVVKSIFKNLWGETQSFTENRVERALKSNLDRILKDENKLIALQNTAILNYTVANALRYAKLRAILNVETSKLDDVLLKEFI